MITNTSSDFPSDSSFAPKSASMFVIVAVRHRLHRRTSSPMAKMATSRDRSEAADSKSRVGFGQFFTNLDEYPNEVDGEAKCEKWIPNDDDGLKESKATRWLNRLIGRKKKGFVLEDATRFSNG